VSSYANGRYPDSALAAIPGGRLRKDAALRWNAMCMYLRAHGRAIPMPNGAYSSYRTLAGQVLMRNQWCARGKCQNAAVPGTSNHGKGISVDTNQGSTVDSVPQFGFDKRHSDAPWAQAAAAAQEPHAQEPPLLPPPRRDQRQLRHRRAPRRQAVPEGPQDEGRRDRRPQNAARHPARTHEEVGP
jgi:hypothetical protein